MKKISKADTVAARRILDTITVDRDYPGPGRKTTNPGARINIYISKSVLAQMDELPGARSHHFERAAKLYLMLVKE